MRQKEKKFLVRFSMVILLDELENWTTNVEVELANGVKGGSLILLLGGRGKVNV